MKTSVQIIPATHTDMDVLTDLLCILFTQEADFKPERFKQMKALELIIDNPDKGFILTARIDNKVVGMVSILKLISTAEGGEVGILEDMIVHPDYHGRGIGSELIKYAIKESEKQQLARLTLLTDSTNQDAIEFYRKHEFRLSAMIPMRRSLL